MQESIKNIIKRLIGSAITILIGVIIIFFLPHNETDYHDYGLGIENRNINVNILDDKIVCEDNIVFYVDHISYNSFRLYNITDCPKYTNNLKASINGTEPTSAMANEIMLPYDVLTSNVGNTFNVKAVYELDKNCIEESENSSIFNYYMDWNHIDYIKNVTINIKSNDASLLKNVETNMKNSKFLFFEAKDYKVKKQNDEYSISINRIPYHENVEFVFNEIATPVKKDVDLEHFNYIDNRINTLIFILVISFLLFLYACIFNINKEKVSSYRRETEDLLPPVLAESLIDGKIGLKELIMTTIIELSTRKNINIINNDTIELVSTNGLESYEKELVDIIFKDSRIIEFRDINRMFLESNTETLTFNSKITTIKNMITDKLSSMNLVSKSLSVINKIIRLISILLIINMPRFFCSPSSKINSAFLPISIFVITYYMFAFVQKSTMKETIIRISKGGHALTFLYMIFAFVLLFKAIIGVAQYNVLFFIGVLLIIVLSVFTSYQCDKNVLTITGKYQRRELMKLKTFLNHYSLIADRNLQSAVIWDKYLAYATAFGMPNQITRTIYSTWNNLNLDLQVADKLIS